MKCISRTIIGPDKCPAYEFYTTGGVPKKNVPATSFVSYYQLSRVPRAQFDLQDRSRYWLRLGDMMRITGIQIKLKMILKAKSGFRIRMLMIQTPYCAEEFLEDGEIVPDNASLNRSLGDEVGSFLPNAQQFSVVGKDGHDVDVATIREKYAGMFEKQLRLTKDMTFHEELMSMKVTHPNMMVLSDRRVFVRNRKNVTRTFNWSFFRKMVTTIRYPPVTYGGEMEHVGQNDPGVPDRKIFVFFIITPAVEQLEVPLGAYRAVDETPDAGHGVQTPLRFGSVAPGPYHLGSIPEEVVEDAEDDEGDGGAAAAAPAQAGPSRVARSRVTTRSGSADPGTQVVDYDRMRDAMVDALNVNRENLREDRERKKKEEADAKLAQSVDEQFTSQWAEDQGMLLKPTFNMWFKDMPKSLSSLVLRPHVRKYKYRR